MKLNKLSYTESEARKELAEMGKTQVAIDGYIESNRKDFQAQKTIEFTTFHGLEDDFVAWQEAIIIEKLELADNK